MKRNLYVPVLTAVVAAFCLALAAHAQSGPGTEPPKTQPTNGLSEEALEAAIKALDPNYKVVPSQDGKGRIYTFKVMRDGWTFDMVIESYQNNIWINAKLSGVISNPQNIPAAALAELLKLQHRIGPMHFTLTKVENGYILNLSWNIGRGITPETFTTVIDYFLKTVKDNYPTWSQVK
jgi:hypothetical protein